MVSPAPSCPSSRSVCSSRCLSFRGCWPHCNAASSLHRRHPNILIILYVRRSPQGRRTHREILCYTRRGGRFLATPLG
eukprot:2785131-Pyramimonas_sp.AAC.1